MTGDPSMTGDPRSASSPRAATPPPAPSYVTNNYVGTASPERGQVPDIARRGTARVLYGRLRRRIPTAGTHRAEQRAELRTEQCAEFRTEFRPESTYRRRTTAQTNAQHYVAEDGEQPLCQQATGLQRGKPSPIEFPSDQCDTDASHRHGTHGQSPGDESTHHELARRRCRQPGEFSARQTDDRHGRLLSVSRWSSKRSG